VKPFGTLITDKHFVENVIARLTAMADKYLF
jgi:hypothetical protein